MAPNKGIRMERSCAFSLSVSLAQRPPGQSQRLASGVQDQLPAGYAGSRCAHSIPRQLTDLARTIARRRELARRYAEKLAVIPGIGVPSEPAWARSNWQSFCVRLPPGCGQFGVMNYLAAEGIASRRGILCAHREPAYPAGSWSCTPDAGAT